MKKVHFLSINVDKNIAEIRHILKTEGSLKAKIYFYNKVKPRGDWDYKRIYGLSLGEDIGNFNYGATGRIAGFRLNQLLRAGGLVSELVGTYSSNYGHFYGNFPYGDDPRDQHAIMSGYYYAK